MASASLKSVVARQTGLNYHDLHEFQCVKISKEDQIKVLEVLKEKELESYGIPKDAKLLKHVVISKEDQKPVNDFLSSQSKQS